jgi:uncharacterized protein YabE (DUF348 family)
MSTIALEQTNERASRSRVPAVAVETAGVAAALLLLWALWGLTARTVTVTVDGVTEQVRTHRWVASDLMIDLGLELQPTDRVVFSTDGRVRNDMQIRIERTPTYRLLVDRRDRMFASWGETPEHVLEAAGVAVSQHDQVLVNGEPWAWQDPLPAPQAETRERSYNYGYAWNGVQTQPIQLRVYRATPLTVNDGGLPYTIHTTAQTVGEALLQAGVTIYLGDEVQPSLGSPVSTDLTVFIDRSTPVSLRVDGRHLKTRTRTETVADALTEMEIGLAGLDVVEPPLEMQLEEDMEIVITRVHEDVEVSEEIVPYETVFVPESEMLIDTQEMVNPGAEGITRQRERVRYENGMETERTLEDTWVAQEPDQRVIAYGTQIVPNTIVTSDGEEITYWRRIRMRATSYSASTAGVSPDAPNYGLTYTGEVMRRGIVAVDPQVIPLRSRVYVPNYGYGEALDTGSAIRARRIDLGYDDDNLVLWSSWTDVYLLWPPPPEYQITWVIPNWPPAPSN